MKIGIDARLINETGVGRYIRNLVTFLSLIDKENEYVIFLPKKIYREFRVPNERWHKRLLTVHWHTIQEQCVLPFVFAKEHLDLLHIPYFTVPLFYPGKVIATIHDITILHVPTGKATTLPYPMYMLKWLAYRCVLTMGIKKSAAVITVSNTVKKELISHLHVPANKIAVTYEGVDPIFLSNEQEPISLSYQYFLYVGNVYPHKQAEFLVHSYHQYRERMRNKKSNSYAKLVFVGKNDFFYDRLRLLINSLHLTEDVIFFTSITDVKLRNLYHHAQALLFPSQSEGFGLPALEALAQECPVIVSDIPVFHELLDTFATYVSHDMAAWSAAMEQVEDEKKHKSKGVKELLGKYSWNILAKETKEIYEHSTRV